MQFNASNGLRGVLDDTDVALVGTLVNANRDSEQRTIPIVLLYALLKGRVGAPATGLVAGSPIVVGGVGRRGRGVGAGVARRSQRDLTTAGGLAGLAVGEEVREVR